MVRFGQPGLASWSCLLKQSLQKVYARTLGGRDFPLFEAVHLGLRLPLVIPLMSTFSLNTGGVRKLKTAADGKWGIW